MCLNEWYKIKQKNRYDNYGKMVQYHIENFQIFECNPFLCYYQQDKILLLRYDNTIVQAKVMRTQGSSHIFYIEDSQGLKLYYFGLWLCKPFLDKYKGWLDISQQNKIKWPTKVSK